MNKYIIRFLKNRFIIAFVSASLFFALFFFTLLWCKSPAFSPYFAFWVYVPALIWLLADVLLTIRFKRIIRYQEQLLGVEFNDTNANPLYPGSNTFLSDDWLIFAGKSAFHRQYIKRITINPKNTNIGLDYWLKIYTNDGKEYKRHIDSQTNTKKIQIWYKNNAAKS